MLKVHLDTDIGDDLDDAFCLALLLCSPEISLAGVTTVFNDTRDRAAMSKVMCDAADVKVPIVAGMGGTMSTSPIDFAIKRKPVYHATQRTFDGPGPESLIGALADVRKNADVLLAIGPLTNIAASLVADPNVSHFPRCVFMCAEFQTSMAEWNIRNDVEAAARVFDAKFPIDVIPWKIGIVTKLLEPERQRIRATQSPLGLVLADYMRQFHVHEPTRADMFDPMTVVALMKPELFKWERGFIHVETRGSHAYGVTMFHRDDNGPHRWASDVDATAAKEWMLQRLCR
jgi:purine nucleosidase